LRGGLLQLLWSTLRCGSTALPSCRRWRRRADRPARCRPDEFARCLGVTRAGRGDAAPKFYETLFGAADKQIAWEIVTGLNVRINQLRSMTIASENRREPAIAEMTEIMDAIRSRRPDEAEAAARRYVESAWQIARNTLRLG
jgi:DNA-binding GntR family transcriptional regulator